ncbi:hypothetical protein [Pacificibacter marinus]|uniref:SIR2-like domain-containing protein n=1 Tax=Pacificibacter marinus TaxID=658057 RepID=A0A1Y5RED1_9RHOB|nr:hypothetical protein [Pacificibacter marinus]SEK25655.1 hypothetical protein SAMN04488032_101493 [Pacificibacter marinus]SLN12943.1 hypothetical protein PAM7971_00154 [Pacificibacter marinus]
MDFKTLTELLDDAPVTLVLGAGASKDYGLPDWNELKTHIIDEAREKPLSLNISDGVFDIIIQALEEAGDKTLDNVAGSLGRQLDGFAARCGLQKLIAYCLIDAEKSCLEKNELGWIELFCSELQKYLRSASDQTPERKYDKRLQNLKNLNVVSLNYDRVFLYNFFYAASHTLNNNNQSFRERITLERSPPYVYFGLCQPHGVLGTLPKLSTPLAKVTSSNLKFFGGKSSNIGFQWLPYSPLSSRSLAVTALPFGETAAFLKLCEANSIDDHIDLNIAAVDDFDDEVDSRNYVHSNQQIKSSHVVCIGLSDLGFNQSQLNFSAAKSVTLTNTSKELRKFDNNRLPTPNVVYFDADGIYATPLIKKMAE